MTPQPLYRVDGQAAAYQLRYSWTGWPYDGRRWKRLPDEDILQTIKPLWEKDGLRLLENTWSCEEIHLTFSTPPAVSPVFLAARAKGRLQDALRKTQPGFEGFSRKISVRSLGDNTREEVERYVASQVKKAGFIDPRFREAMEECTMVCPEVDLSQPDASARGRYWYNLHLVLVVVERFPICDLTKLWRIRDGCFRIAEKKEYRIAALSVMPDHLHAAMRGNIQESPETIALAFQNNLAYLLGQVAIWQNGYYVGTFSEYRMAAVRRRPEDD